MSITLIYCSRRWGPKFTIFVRQTSRNYWKFLSSQFLHKTIKISVWNYIHS